MLPADGPPGGDVRAREGVAAAGAVDVRVVWGRVRCWGAFSSPRTPSALRRLLDGVSASMASRRRRLAPRVRHRRDSPHKSHRWHGEELSIEQQIKNHVARESFGLGEVKIAPGAKQGEGGGAEGWVEKAEVVLA